MTNLTDALDTIAGALDETSRRSLRNSLPSELRGQLSVPIRTSTPTDQELQSAITSVALADSMAVHVIQLYLFPFSALTCLKDVEIQKLLIHVGNPTLAQALMGANEAVSAYLLKNLSARRRALIQDEMNDVEVGEVSAAQTMILDEVRRQYDAGHINTYFGSAEKRQPAPVGEKNEPKKRVLRTTKKKLGFKMKVLLGAGVLLIGVVAVWFLIDTFTGQETGEDASKRTSGTSKRAGEILPKERATGRTERPYEENARQKLVERDLEPGRSLDTGKYKAVIELSDSRARIVAGAATEIHQENEGSDEAGPLNLRLGTIGVEIKDADFGLLTPLVKIAGNSGTKFQVTIVLDATTKIRVFRGSVHVQSLEVDHFWTLDAGQQGSFSSGGKAQIRKTAD